MTRVIDAIIRDLQDRIESAQAIERDHKSDPPVVRRELAGYTRALQDALFVVRQHKPKSG